MDLKTLIEKLLTAAPPGAVVKKVTIDLAHHQSEERFFDIFEIWYDKITNTISIQGG